MEIILFAGAESIKPEINTSKIKFKTKLIIK
jgi:hypothetical protein